MRVVVALTSFNGSAFLSDQLATIPTQLRPVDRIFLANDGSPTPYRRAWMGSRRQIRIAFGFFPAVGRRGLAGNAARALVAAAHADVVFPCDQDDLWHQDKVA
ncbi:MAG: hypothetical protein ACK5TK_02805 [Betaproteobacteria bacterium]